MPNPQLSSTKGQGRHSTLSFAATRQGPAEKAGRRLPLAGPGRQRAWSTIRSPTQRRAQTSLSPAAEGDGRGRGGVCLEMAAAAVSSAKRSFRAELKQRLRALSAEERLRQSHLLTQKVRQGFRQLNGGARGLACLRRRTSPRRVRVLWGARP